MQLKALLKDKYKNVFKRIDETSYINIPIFKMGGGYNMTDVVIDNSSIYNEEISLNPYSYALDRKTKYTNINSHQSLKKKLC